MMFDETADCTVTEQVAIHARFIDASSGKVYLLQPEGTDHDVCIRMSAEVITCRIQDYATQTTTILDCICYTTLVGVHSPMQLMHVVKIIHSTA